MGNAGLDQMLASGSSIVELRIGVSYLRADRPGVYTVVQFDSSEQAVVKEHGSNALHTVAVRLLRPLATTTNTRNQALTATGEDEIAAAEQRLKAIEPLLKFRRIPKAELTERAKEVGKSPKTLRKWIQRFRSDPRLSTLTRKKRTDSGGTRFEPLIENELAAAIESMLTNGNLTLKDAHGDMGDSIRALGQRLERKDLKIPSYGTFYARYLQISEKAKAEAKLGKRPARLLHGISKGQILDADHPLAIVQVDHLELPIELVDEEFRIPIGKGWITVLIDLNSRCVAGFYITLESPGNLSLGLAMSHAILAKDADLALLGFPAIWPVSGFMWALHADNAGEFHGNMLELAAKEYQIELMFRKVREPNYGGHIETYLGTLSEKLRRLPGATREGPHALGETDPKAGAVMTLSELEKYVRTLIIEYHNTPHAGLQQRTPLGKFKAGMRGEDGALPVGRLRQASNPEKLRIDFMPVDERCVHPAGIVWDKIWYVDDSLQRWVNALDPKNIHEKRKFIVHRDPRDLARIYFWDPELKSYRIIGTRNLSRPSISLWELRGLQSFLKERGKEEVDEQMIFDAREERRQIQEQAVAKTQAAQRQRARANERARRAKAGASNAAQSVAAAPPPTRQDEPSPNAPDVRGVAYTMDWGDA